MPSWQAEKVIAFAQEGAPVVLVASERVQAHDEEEGDHIRQAGGKVTFVASAASDVAAVKHLAGTTGGG
jgi:NAD(P)-dependent dehydrogenase (short-subunit alcohol dehydrogenase family)